MYTTSLYLMCELEKLISYRMPPAIGDTFYETAPIQIDAGCDTDCDTDMMSLPMFLRLVLCGVFLSFACVILYRWNTQDTRYDKSHLIKSYIFDRISKACSKVECDEDGTVTATKAHKSLVKQI